MPFSEHTGSGPGTDARSESARRQQNDSRGIWLFVELDIAKFQRAVHLNISLSERLVQQIHTATREHKLSNSAFLAMATDRETMACGSPSSEQS